MTDHSKVQLPDLFRCEDGTRVCSVAQWEVRRQELRNLLVELEYGGLPPAPAETRWEELHVSTPRHLSGARFICGRISTGPDHPFSFMFQLLVPPVPLFVKKGIHRIYPYNLQRITLSLLLTAGAAPLGV
jgi:hypothetical protein